MASSIALSIGGPYVIPSAQALVEETGDKQLREIVTTIAAQVTTSPDTECD